MNEFVRISVKNSIGEIILDRPKALNSLSLDMVRMITESLHSWRDDASVGAVLIRSSSERAFCAGGDIRFFHEAGMSTPRQGSALLEDFFTEEYRLNHLIHFYPKPYIALMDGIVMGGGMGIAQGGDNCIRVVTELSKVAMPEVNIGLFPDVGGSYFLSRAPGELGTYLGLTGETIAPEDALHAGLADFFIPSADVSDLVDVLISRQNDSVRATIESFADSRTKRSILSDSVLAREQDAINRHFAGNSVADIMSSLSQDRSEFSQKALSAMRKRSPLMMCVTLAQLRRGAEMTLADCLRMERNMVRRSFEDGEVLEGIRSVVIDKDNMPQWSPSDVIDVTEAMVERFFDPAWPSYAHPLHNL